MSNTGLVFQVHDPQGAHRLHDEIVEFVGISTTAGPGNRFEAIDAMAGSVDFNKAGIAGFFRSSPRFQKSPDPRKCLPIPLPPGRRT